MQDYAKLSGLAEVEISALEADGIKPTAAEIVRINALAWNVETPESRRRLSRGIPVPVGGTYLWPLTIAAHDWIDRVTLPKRYRNVALGFAMANGRDDGLLDVDRREAVKAINRWYNRLRCTNDELLIAISQILQQDESYELPPLKEDEKPLGLGEVVLKLSAITGTPAEFWERRCSASYAFSMLSTVIIQNDADAMPQNEDDRIRAERALGWYLDRISKTRKDATNV